MSPSLTKNALKSSLEALSDPLRAAHSQRFFKTGAGEYAHGDLFLGIAVPKQRQVAKAFLEMPYTELSSALADPIHEMRAVALFILVLRYQKFPQERAPIYDFYFDHLEALNNWDLVDNTAYHIAGDFLRDKPLDPLFALLEAPQLFRRRIAVIATFAFIREHRFEPTLFCAKKLLLDREDLIHKAVGWMLREVGKRDDAVLRAFLDTHAPQMPRTMLRYAVEKFDKETRAHYLQLGK